MQSGVSDEKEWLLKHYKTLKVIVAISNIFCGELEANADQNKTMRLKQDF